MTAFGVAAIAFGISGLALLVYTLMYTPMSSPSTSPGRSVVGASLPASPQVSDQPGGTEQSVPQPSNGFPPGI